MSDTGFIPNLDDLTSGKLSPQPVAPRPKPRAATPQFTVEDVTPPQFTVEDVSPPPVTMNQKRGSGALASSVTPSFKDAVQSAAAGTVQAPRNPITQPSLAELMDINAPRELAPHPNSMPGAFEGHPENIGEWVPSGPGALIHGLGKGLSDLYLKNNPDPKELLHDLSEAGSGAGNTLLPMAPFQAAAAPLATLASAARAYGAGKAARYGAKALGADQGVQNDAESLGFWAPMTFGMMLKPKVGVGITPEEVNVRGAVAPGGKQYGVELRFPRGGYQRTPAGPGIEPPTIEGNPQPAPPVDESAQKIALYDTVMQRAMNVAQGKPPVEPPPVPPPISQSPNAPPSVQQGHIAPEDVNKVATALAQLPPDIRPQAMQEVHGTLTKVLLELGQKGPVPLPNGQLAEVKDEAAASKEALKIINSAVTDHDKAQEVAAKEAEKTQAEAAKPKPAEPSQPAATRTTSRQRAAKLAEAAYKVEDVEPPQFQIEDVEPPSGGSVNGESRLQEGRSTTAASIATEPKSDESTVQTEHDGGGKSKVRVNNSEGQLGKSEPTGHASIRDTSEQAAAFSKGDSVTFSKNMQIPKGSGQSEIIRQGTKASIEYINPDMKFARVRMEDGRTQSVPFKYIEASVHVSPNGPEAPQKHLAVPYKLETAFDTGERDTHYDRSSRAEIWRVRTDSGDIDVYVHPGGGFGEAMKEAATILGQNAAAGVDMEKVFNKGTYKPTEGTVKDEAQFMSSHRALSETSQSQSPKTHWHGDAAEYTGKSEMLHGAKFYEIKLTEGHLAGETKLTQNPPSDATLPGMEQVPAERAEANSDQQGKDLTAKLTELPKSIEAKAGEIEQHSPLFRDTEANPQGGLFGGEQTDFDLLRGEKGEFTPAVAAKAAAQAAGRVGEFLKQEVDDTRRAKELQWDMYDLDKRHEARVLRAKQMLEGLKKDGVTQEDRRAIDEHLDALQADSDHVPIPALTPFQDKILDEVLLPMKDEAEAAYKKVNAAGMTIPNYNPRQTKGRMGMLDRFLMPEGEKKTGRSNLLSKTNPATKHRTMMALEFEKAGDQTNFIHKPGDRLVISLKGGQVTAWENGTPQNIGPIMDTEEGKGFVDSDGNVWKLKQATKNEIEKHTNVEYYHDAAASTIVNWLQAKKAEAAHDFLENFKKDPDFDKVAMPTDAGNPPSGWRTTNLPQMKGYYFEPHTAEVFDWFFDRLKSGDPNAFDSLNNYMRIKILINPIKHPLNVGAQWAVNKGVTGFLPNRWMKIGRTGARAINDIWNTTPAAMEALDAGAPFQSFRGATHDLVKAFYEQVGDGLTNGEPWATKLATAMGLTPKQLLSSVGTSVIGKAAENAHWLSSKIAWPVGDMMFLQSAYEYQEDHPGVSLHDALREVGRTMPEYRIPTRILDSVAISKLMSSKNLSVFGSWHYGLLRSFTENAKSALGGGEPAPGRTKAEEVGKGWDRLALMALGAFFIYPLLHKLAQKITGNKDAEVAGHGVFSYLNAAAKVAKREETVTQAATKVLTPNPLSEDLTSIFLNRDLKSGRHIRDDAADWQVQGQQLMQYLKEEGIPLYSDIYRAQHSPDGGKKFAWNQLDVNFPKHGAAKLAAEIASGKMDTSAWTPEERERYYARQEALDGLRKGDSSAFERGLEKVAIRPDEISQLLHRSMGSQLFDKVHGFTYDETKRVYDAAVKDNDEESQQQLLPLLIQKQQNLLKKGRFEEAGVH